MRAGQDLAAAGYVGLKGTAAVAEKKEEELLKRFSRRFVDGCMAVEREYGIYRTPDGRDTTAEQIRRGTAAEPVEQETAAEQTRREAAAEPSSDCLWNTAGATEWMEAGEGGILAALWNFFEEHGMGFELELRALPILQETVEVCEVFDLNPYCLRSEGCILLTADNGGDLVRNLAEAGIRAAVVGKVTEGPGKRIHNGEIHSFLNRPKPDELDKVITKSN